MHDPDAIRQSDPERAAIRGVIEQETAAWLHRDIRGWADCWIQDGRAQHVIARPSVGARVLKGFQAIHDHMADAMARLPESGVDPSSVIREDWRIALGADMAWVTFDQIVPLGAPSLSAPGRHNHMRILMKQDGAWKILGVFHIPNRIGYYQFPWVRVDAAGRVIESGPGAEDTLREHKTLHIVGERLCGRRRADNARLKTALTEADTLIRKRIGRRPVPLVLSEAEDLSVSLCWVSIADMMIVILLGDDHLLTQTIARAGEVFGLSPAQIRVAGEIARGHDLKTAARKIGVQPNTVRTHLRRMFLRVGVNSQPALVRALLSVEPPRT